MARLAGHTTLHGTVCSIREHALHAMLAVAVGGSIVRVDVRMGPIRHARIAEDDPVAVSFKAEDVVLATSGQPLPVSVATQLPGTVLSIEASADGTEALVEVEIASGTAITAAASPDALGELGITVGSQVLALITACDVMPDR